MRDLNRRRRQRTSAQSTTVLGKCASITHGSSWKRPRFVQLDFRSVHDQVSRNGFGSVRYRRMTELLRLQNFAEFFAELCAEEAPIAPLHSSLLR